MSERNRPEVKIMAVSNVYSRLMIFKKVGDFENGHYHTYDHGTLLSKGKLLVEMFDKQNNLVATKVYTAPTFIMIKKDNTHRLTAMEDDTIAACIHALRDVDDDLVDPDFFPETTELTDDITKDNTKPRISDIYAQKGMIYTGLALDESDLK